MKGFFLSSFLTLSSLVFSTLSLEMSILDSAAYGAENKEKLELMAVPSGPFKYDLDDPYQVDILPSILDEVSGVTEVSPTEVALVQDEKGIIFIFDLRLRKITKEIPFGPDGDYEGVARVDNVIYVLESSGNVYKVGSWKSKPVVKKIELGLPTKDNEGLCYDPVSAKLLIAPKSRWMKEKEKKSLRPLFGFDFKSENIVLNPFIILDTDRIDAFVLGKGEQVPTRISKKGKKIERFVFKPSALTVHPVTHEIFMMSAVGKTLVSFNRQGEVTNHWKLNAEKFLKPEGITFLADSTMVVSNEAAGQKATLMQFKPKQ